MSKNVQIIVSESATYNQIGQKQNTALMNPLLGLFLPYIPTAGSFVITVVGFYEKPVNDIKINIEIEYNDKIIFTAGETTISSTSKQKEEKMNLGINLDVRNMSLPGEGEYVINCYLNDEVHKHSFFVYKINEVL